VVGEAASVPVLLCAQSPARRSHDETANAGSQGGRVTDIHKDGEMLSPSV
jgi:hypothetical protein